MVYAIFADLRRVYVLEGELDPEVHLVGALGLADQSELGVVQHDENKPDVVLRGNRQFLDQELTSTPSLSMPLIAASAAVIRGTLFLHPPVFLLYGN
jgi:hypothetical protein